MILPAPIDDATFSYTVIDRMAGALIAAVVNI